MADRIHLKIASPEGADAPEAPPRRSRPRAADRLTLLLSLAILWLAVLLPRGGL